MEQAKVLAQELETARFTNASNEILARENTNLYQAIEKQKFIVSSLGFQVANLQQINQNHITSRIQLEQEKKRIVRRNKWQKLVLSGGLGLVSFLSIIH